METNMQTFTLPREAFNLLLEALGGQQKAEVFSKSMESFLVAIDNKATAGIVEKKEMVKIEVREELRKELVTREMFDGQRKEINEKFNVVDEKLKSLEKEIRERFNVVDERFHVVDEKFISLEKVMNARFNVVDEKLKSLNFKLNLFLAVALIALTFANPAFVELIKKYFKGQSCIAKRPPRISRFISVYITRADSSTPTIICPSISIKSRGRLSSRRIIFCASSNKRFIKRRTNI
jgi:hypothetical protein